MTVRGERPAIERPPEPWLGCHLLRTQHHSNRQPSAHGTFKQGSLVAVSSIMAHSILKWKMLNTYRKPVHSKVFEHFTGLTPRG